MLEIKTVLPSLSIVTCIDELRATGNTHVDPFIFMSPSVEIAKNLRFSASSLSPEKPSSVKAFECSFAKSNSSNVFWAPVMIAFFVVALEIHFELYVFMLLKLNKTFRKVLLFESYLDKWKTLNNLREVMKDKVLLLTHVHDSMYNLVDHMISSCFVSQMWSQWLLSKLLQQNIHKPIENTWSIKEFLELLMRLVRCLFIDIVD